MVGGISTLASGDLQNISKCVGDNSSSINALECLRPWTSPHAQHLMPVSSATIATINPAVDGITSADKVA